MYPTLFKQASPLGEVPFNSWGLMITIAFLVASLVSQRRAAKEIAPVQVLMFAGDLAARNVLGLLDQHTRLSLLVHVGIGLELWHNPPFSIASARKFIPARVFAGQGFTV